MAGSNEALDLELAGRTVTVTNPGKAYFNFKCDERVVINPGDSIRLSQNEKAENNCKIVCLAARKQFIKPSSDAPRNDEAIKLHKPKDRDGSDNANSVVMLLDFGPAAFDPIQPS